MNTHKNEKGIILLEAIVAVGVLATMFAATMALFTYSVQGVRISSDQLIATYLAQDAMEQVVGKNQYNADNFFAWLLDLGVCSGASGCAMNYLNEQDFDEAPLSCASSNSCKLYFDGAVYTATNTGGGAGAGWSRFTRVTRINVVGHEAHVTVTVSWPDGPTTMEYSLQFTLYDTESAFPF